MSVGKFGGGDLSDKLKASVEREHLLLRFAKSEGFDASISSNSPEASRVSFRLGIDHYIYGDSPHGVAANKLASPLAKKLFTPFAVPKERWTQFGLRSEQVLQYHATDPWCWLLGMRELFSGRNPKRNDSHRKILIRLEEWFASYMKKGMGISRVLYRLIDAISKEGDYEIILVPRYEDQRRWAKREFGNRCIVPDTAIDGAESISEMDLVIGGGGTMTQEAALLGIPNISYFPSARLDVFENFYFPKRLSIKASRPEELIRLTRNTLHGLDTIEATFRERAKEERGKFEDPAAFIFEHM
jgi:predicted glycosyltransferase